MTHPMHKKHGTHIEQVIKIFELVFKLTTVKCIKNELMKINVSVISLLIFYDNRGVIVYKVIGAVLYNIIDNYICIYFMGLLQDKMSKHNNRFEKTKFNDFYGLGIPEILINIMSCHGFYKSSISTVIFT